jgi:hypothetical protein
MTHTHNLRYSLFALFSAFSMLCAAQDSTIHNRVLIALNINSCSFCNKATNTILDPALAGHVDLLFSSDDSTPEQIDEFISINFTKKPRYVFNDRLYREIAGKMKIFKNPYFIILDTTNTIIKYFPIDSVDFYYDLIETTATGKHKRTEIINDRIKRMAGYYNVNKVNDYLFVSTWSNTSKTYYYDLKKNSLDSLYFSGNDKLIYKLLDQKGVKNINVPEVRKLYKQKRLPYELVSFGTRPYNDQHKLYNSLYVEYLDPKNLSDTISTELLFFLFSFDPRTRDLQIHNYKYWEKAEESGEITDDLRLDYVHISQHNDSLWLMGAEHIENRDNSEKTFLYFATNGDSKELRYNGNRFSVKTDTLVTFNNEPMNNPVRLFLYQLLPSYLLYYESPYYFNTITGKTSDIRHVSEDISWIFSARETEHTLSVLVEENAMLVLYVLDKSSEKALRKDILGKNDTKGNAVLDSHGNVIYVNKKGAIVWYKL